MVPFALPGEDFWKLSQGKAKGTIGYATYAADDPRPIVQNWLKLWRETTKRPNDAPDGFVTAYYEGTFILADVLLSEGHQRPQADSRRVPQDQGSRVGERKDQLARGRLYRALGGDPGPGQRQRRSQEVAELTFGDRCRAPGRDRSRGLFS